MPHTLQYWCRAGHYGTVFIQYISLLAKTVMDAVCMDDDYQENDNRKGWFQLLVILIMET